MEDIGKIELNMGKVMVKINKYCNTQSGWMMVDDGMMVKTESRAWNGGLKF